MPGFANAVRLPSAKFPEIGDRVHGVVSIIEETTVPVFDQKTGRIKQGEVSVDENNDPIMQMDVTLAKLDAEGNAIPGAVVLHTGGAIYYAIGRALAEIGADDLDLGDLLTVTYTADGEATKGRNAPKQYEAVVIKSGDRAF